MGTRQPYFSLIIPAASNQTADKGKMPEVFSFDREGIMLCIKSILGLNLERFDKIYFTILRKHVEAFDLDILLGLQFRRLGIENAEIVILNEPTSTQAETIYKTIEEKGIKGSIFIKDSDSSFKAEIYPENGVAVFPLEKLPLVDPRNKSYVSVDDMQYITNIIEKRIVSNMFNVGGYCFEKVEDFMDIYKECKGFGKIYLSHLIYAMLLNGHQFRPIRVCEYKDYNLHSGN